MGGGTLAYEIGSGILVGGVSGPASGLLDSGAKPSWWMNCTPAKSPHAEAAADSPPLRKPSRLPAAQPA